MGILLVGFDGSDPSRRALAHAVRRAGAADEVVVLNVIPPSVAQTRLNDMMPLGIELPPPLSRTFLENARARLEEALREHATSGVKLRAEVRVGETEPTLVEAVRELGAEEVVIGHKSYEHEDLGLGPIAERLVRTLPATVTVVR